MAKIYNPIIVTPLFKNLSLSAGDSGTSDIIPLDGIANNGLFSLHASVATGTSGTAGTTVFSYLGCSQRNGTFVAPSNADTIGTCGTAKSSDLCSFEPELMPFMKIVATQSGTGTAGFDSKITADLITQ